MSLAGAEAKKSLGLGTHLLLWGGIYLDYRMRTAGGEGEGTAMAKAAGMALFTNSMGFWAGTAVLAGYSIAEAATKGMYNLYQSQGSWLRTARTPFSHSFSHTAATSQLQSAGLRALGISRGFVGSEASLMAERYGGH
jgi:hypothetical protein